MCACVPVCLCACVPVCLSSHVDKLSQDVNWHKACLLGAHVSHLVSNTMTD